MSKINNETNLCENYTFDNFNVQGYNKFAYTTFLSVANKGGYNL